MRFRLDPRWDELDDILRRHDLKPVAFALDVKAADWVAIDEDVEAGALQPIVPGEPFRVSGQPVFVYIRDTRIKGQHASAQEASRYPEEYTRIHLTECTRISEMRKENRFARYVRTNKKDGPLRMNLTSKDGLMHSTSMDLRVCMLCLDVMNWQGYRDLRRDKTRRSAIWRAFSRTEFLEKYTPTFSTNPYSHEDDAPHIYTPDWPEISKRERARARYECGDCGVRVDQREAHLLDVHHKNHLKSDNKPENLSVFCKLCHADIHPHYVVQRDQADRITALRAMQGIRR